jgi:hypothetical protein
MLGCAQVGINWGETIMAKRNVRRAAANIGVAAPATQRGTAASAGI